MQVPVTRLIGCLLMVCASAAPAGMYLCEQNGGKTYSDRPCGTGAKHIGEKEHYGPVRVQDIPDADTQLRLCQLARRGKVEERELIRRSAEHELSREQYNAGIMQVREQLNAQLQMSGSFQCRRSLAQKIRYIVTSGYPFGYVGELPADGVQKCVAEIEKAISETAGEPPGC